jgi:pyridinium-3,5-biscarboxylic acid mononucleotide synthase
VPADFPGVPRIPNIPDEPDIPNETVPSVPSAAEAGAAGVPLGEYALLDVDRRRRTGVPEVVFGPGKTPEQIVQLLAELRARDPEVPALATRCPDSVLEAVAGRFPGQAVHVDEAAGTVAVGDLPPARGHVLVVTAGTTDLRVARECAATLAVLGVGASVLADVGVAGLGRLLSRLDDLRAADCVVVAAGMDGALPSVVAGLVSVPVIGLPTSVGYGVAAGGVAAAVSMLASCSPGLVVVNIDNGFGAAVHAAKIIRAVHRD